MSMWKAKKATSTAADASMDSLNAGYSRPGQARSGRTLTLMEWDAFIACRQTDRQTDRQTLNFHEQLFSTANSSKQPTANSSGSLLLA
jgi:hypothetical protein